MRRSELENGVEKHGAALTAIYIPLIEFLFKVLFEMMYVHALFLSLTTYIPLTLRAAERNLLSPIPRSTPEAPLLPQENKVHRNSFLCFS